MIAAGLHPDHSVISEFRRAHCEALEKLYLAVLMLCQKAGLVKLGHVSLDGTKVQANASKHKAMSFERMQKTEAELTRQIEELLAGAEQADKKEDEQHVLGKRGDEIPEELRRREKRLQTIREAKAALLADAAATRAEEVAAQAERARQKALEAASAEEAAKAERAEERAKEAAARAKARADERVQAAQEAAKKAAEKATTLSEKRAARRARLALEAAERDRDAMKRRLDGNADTLPAHRVPSDKDGNPTPSAQRNFTDADSRIMKSGTGDYVQGYNCQAAVDAANQIIVAQGVTNQAPGRRAPSSDARRRGVQPRQARGDDSRRRLLVGSERRPRGSGWSGRVHQRRARQAWPRCGAGRARAGRRNCTCIRTCSSGSGAYRNPGCINDNRRA